MQKNEILEFFNKIDQDLHKNLRLFTDGSKFNFKIIGKSALLLAGLTDSTGTVDIDSLGLEGQSPDPIAQNIITHLLKEFGRNRLLINGHYLEFVAPAIVFLCRSPEWNILDHEYKHLSVQYLDPHHVIASKFFSAFATPARKKDKQDIVIALDQRVVNFQKTLNLVDDLFDFYSMDARAERFPEVHAYIIQDLMSKYGTAYLKYELITLPR